MIVILLAAAGCSSANLGQIDETRDARDDMPGPGIFTDESGETALQWSSDGQQSPPVVQQPGAAGAGDKSEFEQFKKWNRLRTEQSDSAEYQEFLLWLKFQEFKNAQ